MTIYIWFIVVISMIFNDYLWFSCGDKFMIIYVSVDDNGVYKPANIAGGVPPCVQALPVVVANSRSSSAAVRRCRSRGLKEPRSLLPWGTDGHGDIHRKKRY